MAIQRANISQVDADHAGGRLADSWVAAAQLDAA